MSNNWVAFLIAAGAVGLFVVGWAAGYTDAQHDLFDFGSNNDFRVQWEVLLTGVAALIAGRQTYKAATWSTRRTIEVEAIRLFRKLMPVKTVFRSLDPSGEDGKLLAQAAERGVFDGIQGIANEALEAIEGISSASLTPELARAEQILKQDLLAVRNMRVLNTKMLIECSASAKQFYLMVQEIATKGAGKY